MRPPLWTHDRRRALRVEVPPRAAVDARGSDTDVPVRLRQVSIGGMLVEGLVALEPGSDYDVRLAVAGHPVVTLTGRVVHSRATLALDADARVRFLSAVSFARLSDDASAALASIVASLAPEASEASEAGEGES